jgi:hypothetical protein
VTFKGLDDFDPVSINRSCGNGSFSNAIKTRSPPGIAGRMLIFEIHQKEQNAAIERIK